MRKITMESIRAFNSNRNFKKSNTEVISNVNGTFLLLWDNCIAHKHEDKLFVTLAGWNSNTTRERLNGLAGVDVTSKNYTPYLNGEKIDACEWYEIGV